MYNKFATKKEAKKYVTKRFKELQKLVSNIIDEELSKDTDIEVKTNFIITLK